MFSANEPDWLWLVNVDRIVLSSLSCFPGREFPRFCKSSTTSSKGSLATNFSAVGSSVLVASGDGGAGTVAFGIATFGNLLGQTNSPF